MEAAARERALCSASKGVCCACPGNRNRKGVIPISMLAAKNKGWMMTSGGGEEIMELPAGVSMPVIEHTLIFTYIRGNAILLGKWSRATPLLMPDFEHS